MATIRKRGNKWQVQVRKIGHAPVSRSFDLRKDAEAWARQSEHAIDLGEAGLTSARTKDRTSLDSVLNRYLEEVTPGKRSARTEKSRIGMLRRQELAGKAVTDIRASDIAAIRTLRLKTVSGETVRQDLVLLRQVFEFARKECCIRLRVNPCDDVQKPLGSRPRTRRLSEREVALLSAALSRCRNTEIARVTHFAIATGMRRGEILALRWRDIDLVRHTCLLHLTKNGWPRTVPLSAQAIAVLTDGAPGRRDDDPVFPVTVNAFRMAWKRVQERSGIADFRFHDLRHEAISRFFERGLSLPEVALISGHRDPRQLLRYTHLSASDLAVRL